MKKTKENLSLILLITSLITTMHAQQPIDSIAQKPSVEKKLRGVQLGLLNLSFQYESRLARKFTLLAEAGLELAFSQRKTPTETTSYGIVFPHVTAEPRWYYGLDRRIRKGKNINNNGSNYLSLRTTYASADTPIINNAPNNTVPSLFIIPKFGIRRNFAKNFNYEFSFGYGYQLNIFNANNCPNCPVGLESYDIQTRIGYNF
jgi:hypothetical protein